MNGYNIMLCVGFTSLLTAGTALGQEFNDGMRWFESMEIAAGTTGILQGSSGVVERLAPNGDTTDGSMSVDLEMTMPVVSNGTFYTLFETGGGDGIDTDIPVMSGFNDDADDDPSVRLTEVWYEHAWRSNGVRLRAGKVDLTTDFDVNAVANSETEQFLSSGFVNNPLIEFPDDNGLGAMLWVSLGDNWDIGAGIAETDADWNNIFKGVFSIVELDFKPVIAGRPSAYRIHYWFNGAEHTHLKRFVDTPENNYGFGLSFDQQLTDILTVFARFGIQHEKVAQFGHGWSTGFQHSGRFMGRASDTVGAAYGLAAAGGIWRDSNRITGINTGNEHHLELYYNMNINDHLSLTPDLQWVKNPEGEQDNRDVWAFGLRTQVSF